MRRKELSLLNLKDAAALEESVRATNIQKIEQFAVIPAIFLDPGREFQPREDIASTIRDVAQLSETDIWVLQLIASAFEDVVKTYPNLSDPNAFTEKIDDCRRKVFESKLHPDDFQGTCDRLRGFGFAGEVFRNVGRMAPNEFCFRPTRRGLRLLKALGEMTEGSRVG